MHRNEPNEHLLKRRLIEGCAMFENFFILYENLRFNTYLLKYQLIHNRVGMN